MRTASCRRMCTWGSASLWCKHICVCTYFIGNRAKKTETSLLPWVVAARGGGGAGGEQSLSLLPCVLMQSLPCPSEGCAHVTHTTVLKFHEKTYSELKIA